MENAFGILAQRWRFLVHTSEQGPHVVHKKVNAAICVHNLMRMRYPDTQNAALDWEDNNHNLIPGEWRLDANRHEVEHIVGANHDNVRAKRMRETLRMDLCHARGIWSEELKDDLRKHFTDNVLCRRCTSTC